MFEWISIFTENNSDLKKPLVWPSVADLTENKFRLNNLEMSTECFSFPSTKKVRLIRLHTLQQRFYAWSRQNRQNANLSLRSNKNNTTKWVYVCVTWGQSDFFVFHVYLEFVSLNKCFKNQYWHNLITIQTEMSANLNSFDGINSKMLNCKQRWDFDFD